MSKELSQVLLTILLELKADVLRLHKGKPTKKELILRRGICEYISLYANQYPVEINLIQNLFYTISAKWPNCRKDYDGTPNPFNCVESFDDYLDQYRAKTQWVNLRRLELLEFSIKYLQEKLNEEVMESN